MACASRLRRRVNMERGAMPSEKWNEFATMFAEGLTSWTLLVLIRLHVAGSVWFGQALQSHSFLAGFGCCLLACVKSEALVPKPLAMGPLRIPSRDASSAHWRGHTKGLNDKPQIADGYTLLCWNLHRDIQRQLLFWLPSACLATKQLRLWTSKLPSLASAKFISPSGWKDKKHWSAGLEALGWVDIGCQSCGIHPGLIAHEATALRCIKWWLRRRNIPVSKDLACVQGKDF